MNDTKAHWNLHVIPIAKLSLFDLHLSWIQTNMVSMRIQKDAYVWTKKAVREAFCGKLFIWLSRVCMDLRH